MADVLYALAIWVLVAGLLGWLFSRAALTLRQPPPTRAELLLRVAQRRAIEFNAVEFAEREATVFDSDALRRAIRVYERI